MKIITNILTIQLINLFNLLACLDFISSIIYDFDLSIYSFFIYKSILSYFILINYKGNDYDSFSNIFESTLF